MTLLSPQQVRRNTTLYLQAALPTALINVSAALNLPRRLTVPRLWVPLSSYITVPEEQLPTVYVAGGLTTYVDTDWDDDTDRYDCAVRVVCVVAGTSRADSQDLATWYADAARYALLADETLTVAGQPTAESLLVRGQGDTNAEQAGDQYRGTADVQATVRVNIARRLPTAPVLVAPTYPHLTVNRLPVEQP